MGLYYFIGIGDSTFYLANVKRSKEFKLPGKGRAILESSFAHTMKRVVHTKRSPRTDAKQCNLGFYQDLRQNYFVSSDFSFPVNKQCAIIS